MNGVIVTGHGCYASGLLSSLKLIAGEQPRVEFVDFLEKDSTDDLQGKIVEKMELLSDCEGVLFLCDLVGGSPFKTAVTLSACNPSQYAVVGGVNLAMLLEISMAKDLLSLSELTNLAVNTGKDAVQLFQMQEPAKLIVEEDGGI